MKNKIFITFLLTLFVVNFISAEVTEINVRTLPGHEIQLTILDAKTEGFQVLPDGRMMGTSDKNGYVVGLDGETLFKYGGGEFSFKLNAFVKDMEGNTVFSQRLEEEFIAGTPIDVEFFPDGKTAAEIFPEPEPIVEQVPVEEVAEEVVEEESNTVLSGAVVLGDFVKGNVPYLVGGVLVIVLFAGGTVLAKKGKLHMPKLHMPHFGGSKSSSSSSQSDRELIDDAEEKIKEAQEEIAKIRKEGKGELTEKEKKIIEAKKKLIEDQKELQDLTDAKD